MTNAQWPMTKAKVGVLLMNKAAHTRLPIRWAIRLKRCPASRENCAAEMGRFNGSQIGSPSNMSLKCYALGKFEVDWEGVNGEYHLGYQHSNRISAAPTLSDLPNYCSKLDTAIFLVGIQIPKTSDPYLTQHQLQSLHGPLPSRKAYGLVKLNRVSPESVWCVLGFCAQPLSPTISDKLHKPISTHCCWWTSRERIETAQWTAYSWTGCCRRGIWIGPIYLFVNNICTSTVYIIDVLDLNGTMSEKVRVDCWFQALQGKMSCGFWWFLGEVAFPLEFRLKWTYNIIYPLVN